MTAPVVAPTPQTGSNPQSVKVTITEDTVNGTEYVILERLTNTTGGVSWREFARETGRSADSALKTSLEGNEDGGTFIAIPARSWKPVKVTPETVTTLKLEEAK